MTSLNWEQLIADLRGDDIERALSAGEQIAAHITAADLERVRELAADDDYFVRVMAGDILANTIGIAALPTLLAVMIRNQEEGYDNDGLDTVTKSLIDANPIIARRTLAHLEQQVGASAQSIARWGLQGVPDNTTVVTPLVAHRDSRREHKRGCLWISLLCVCVFWIAALS